MTFSSGPCRGGRPRGVPRSRGRELDCVSTNVYTGREHSCTPSSGAFGAGLWTCRLNVKSRIVEFSHVTLPPLKSAQVQSRQLKPRQLKARPVKSLQQGRRRQVTSRQVKSTQGKPMYVKSRLVELSHVTSPPLQAAQVQSRSIKPRPLKSSHVRSSQDTCTRQVRSRRAPWSVPSRPGC